MYTFIKLTLLIFLTSLASYTQASDIKIDYDFNKSELLITSDMSYGNCTLTIYKQRHINCVSHLDVFYTQQFDNYSGQQLTIENVPPDKYRINISGVKHSAKEVYIGLVSERMKMSWCEVTDNIPVWYNIYVRDIYTEEYDTGIYIDVGSVTEFDFNYLLSHTKYFMYITADNDLKESGPSNEAIILVVLPSNVKNIKLEK